jgi:hypothetical protein
MLSTTGSTVPRMVPMLSPVRGPIVVALALVCALSASCGSRVTVVPTPNAPHLPPSAEVNVLRGPTPSGARELARIEINGSQSYSTSADEQREACAEEIVREAKRLGADLVRVVEEGRQYNHPSVSYCKGFAYSTR